MHQQAATAAHPWRSGTPHRLPTHPPAQLAHPVVAVALEKGIPACDSSENSVDGTLGSARRRQLRCMLASHAAASTGWPGRTRGGGKAHVKLQSHHTRYVPVVACPFIEAEAAGLVSQHAQQGVRLPNPLPVDEQAGRALAHLICRGGAARG